MPSIQTLLAASMLLVGSRAAPAAEESAAPARTLDTVVVSGAQPGPGLWKVTKDDHTLWILGTLRPLPKGMTWESREVVGKIAQSQLVLMPPAAQIRVRGGNLRAILLVPSLLRARNNPQKRKLVEVVPADLYARWLALKRVYLPRNESVEKRRPIIAAWTLYEKAVERSGMSFRDVATRVVEQAAKRSKVPIAAPRVAVVIEEPRDALREFSTSPLDDLECFRRTLARLESDVEAMKDRGNAWATGDIATLRALPYTDQNRACLDAVLEAGVAGRHGLAGIERRVDAKWLEAAEAALANHRVTFAVLPIGEILKADGYIETLRARGYAVEPP